MGEEENTKAFVLEIGKKLRHGVDWYPNYDRISADKLFKEVVKHASDGGVKKCLEGDAEGKYRALFEDVFRYRKKFSKSSTPMDAETMHRQSLFLGCDASRVQHLSASSSSSSSSSSSLSSLVQQHSLSVKKALILVRTRSSSGPEWATSLAGSEAVAREWASAAAMELGRVISSRLVLQPAWISSRPLQTACVLAYGVLARKGEGGYDSIFSLVLAEGSVEASCFVAATLGYLGFWAKRVVDSSTSSVAACCQPLYVHHYLSAILRQRHASKLGATHIAGLVLLYCWSSGQTALRAFSSSSKLHRDILSFLDQYVKDSGAENLWAVLQGALRHEFKRVARGERGRVFGPSISAEAKEVLEEAKQRADSDALMLSSLSNRSDDRFSDDEDDEETETDEGGDDDDEECEDSDSNGSSDDNNSHGASEDGEGVLQYYKPDDEGTASKMEREVHSLRN